MGRFALRRASVAIPQIILMLVATFFLVHLLPGNPAYELAGLYATPANVAAIDKSLGLDQPLPTQFWKYLVRLAHGDLGESSYTRLPIRSELAHRLPPTLELIGIAAALILVVGIWLGVHSAARSGGVINAGLRVYGGLSGAFPDFWLGLALAYLFYFVLRWLPAPSGQLNLGATAPTHLTGAYLVDALLSGDWVAVSAAFAHVVLPVATLVIAYSGAIVKLTNAAVRNSLAAPYCRHARAIGLSGREVTRYAVRSSLPEIVTLFAVTVSFLLAGDVLVENVFAWGGLGSFMVDSVSHSDYTALQGIVLVTALFNFAVYLVVDLVQLAIDPRVRVRRD